MRRTARRRPTVSGPTSEATDPRCARETSTHASPAGLSQPGLPARAFLVPATSRVTFTRRRTVCRPSRRSRWRSLRSGPGSSSMTAPLSSSLSTRTSSRSVKTFRGSAEPSRSRRSRRVRTRSDPPRGLPFPTTSYRHGRRAHGCRRTRFAARRPRSASGRPALFACRSPRHPSRWGGASRARSAP
jgi:hypothetical protein